MLVLINLVRPSVDSSPEVFLESSPDILPRSPAFHLRLLSSLSRIVQRWWIPVLDRSASDVDWLRSERESEEEAAEADDAAVSTTDHHSHPCAGSSRYSVSFRRYS